jgi:hypothetical protein
MKLAEMARGDLKKVNRNDAESSFAETVTIEDKAPA